jgi:hypothetical protein
VTKIEAAGEEPAPPAPPAPGGKPNAEEIAAAIKQLSPEQALVFLDKLERVYKKQRIQALGYLVAMVVWAGGMFAALVYAGSTEGFTAWVYLVPFALVGAVLYGFGRWASKVTAPIKRKPS